MTDKAIFTARVYHRAEKPYGVGKTARARHQIIVGGWRGEIIGGLEDGRAVYTGVCSSRDETKAELISHLKRLGYTGVLRVV